MVTKTPSLDFKNPVIAAQAVESPFVPDSSLGHTMPPGKDFIGEKGFIDMERLIQKLKGSEKKVVLNIGDSSTSGWDSNIVTQNRERIKNKEPILPAFFQYKTYSDYLNEILGEGYFIINAGVPAHTSLQGSKRLELLLKKFRQNGIKIQWITAYYGNNDSVWDHNRQDKDWVGIKQKSYFNRITNFSEYDETSIIPRVLASDYKANMTKIVDTCEDYYVPLIFIEPLTPIYWKPGTRVLNEDLERKQYPGSGRVYQLLDDARSLWDKAINEGSYTELKKAALEEIREKDYIVPRIKRGHLNALHSVVEGFNVPFIQVELDRSEDDIRYFIDYCHPIQDANKFIAEGIAKIVLGHHSRKEILLELRNRSQQVVQQPDREVDIPTEHYALY